MGKNRVYVSEGTFPKGGKDMTDEKIIELFWSRDENAIKETEKKYGDLCHFVMSGILTVKEDREECVNDVLLALWNSIPPEKPHNLRAYIGTASRNHALNRSRDANAWKRGGNIRIVGEEFLETIDDGSSLAEDFELSRAGKILNEVIGSLKKEDRKIFTMRFWLGLSYPEIARQTGFGESRVKMSVSRTKKKLAERLKKEGILS